MNAEFSDYIISGGASLKTALIKMTASFKGVLLVVDDAHRLLGALADGDIRRALIDDVSLAIPVHQIMNLNPVLAKSRQEATDILGKKPYLLVVPVVDDQGVLVGCVSGFGGPHYILNDLIDGNYLSESGDSTAVNRKVNILAIVPARGGSKRIPQKNLSRIGDKTLLSLAIASAIESSYVDFIIVSTDSDEIAQEARQNGVEVPWLRPADLATDTARSVDVMIHATERFKADFGYAPELILLLEPTAPLRTAGLIDKAIDLFQAHQADSLVSVNVLRHNFHPEELLREKDEIYLTPYLNGRDFATRKSRNDQDTAYVQNGLVYIVRAETLLSRRTMYGEKVLKFETDPELYCDIDENEDLKIASFKMKTR